MSERRNPFLPLSVGAGLAFAASAFGGMHAAHMAHDAPASPMPTPTAPASMSLLQRVVGFWDNYGNYMPRTHCLLKADGTPDWPWIGAVVVLCAGVVAGYYRIYIFWRRNYLAEAPRDRNRKLMDLAYVFLWCAICGYGMSIVLFVWPAYRLLAVFLVVLNVFTHRFATNLGALNVSLSAVRLKRELAESLASRAADLERLVEQRTLELDRARAAAIAADEAKTDFLANMSHEIRTPMTAILGFTELLDNPKLDDATRGRHLRTVRESGRHLLAVVNDILDLARIEAGKLRIEHMSCDLHALVQDVVALLGPRAAERKLVLSLNIEPATPRVIETDPTRLRQVLLNLIGNAIKFTEVGSVAVDVRPDVGDGAHVAIAVIDSGIGMNAAQLARLFERFNTLNVSSQKNAGSGLGLVISRQLVKLLGGDLHVQSEAGVGSRFTVRLPYGTTTASLAPRDDLASAATLNGDGANAARTSETRPNEVTAKSSVTDLPSPMRESERRRIERAVAPERPNFTFPLAARVLLVDDGAENRQLVQFLLEQQGLTVVIAEDGQAAVDRVEAEPDQFDIVLMDIQMPRLDGYAATAKLRSRQFTKPIVALTASTMNGDRERCLAAGCDEYISKPIDIDKLLRTVERFLAK